MVIWPAFRTGQYRVNDHPYHAPQFSRVDSVVVMVAVSLLAYEDFGPKNHREDAVHFSMKFLMKFLKPMNPINFGTMLGPKGTEELLNPNCEFEDTLCFLMITYRK